jgi:heat shock protein HslJ
VLATYTTDGSSLQLVPGPSTLAFCGEDSLDTVFVQRLTEVVTYVMADGKLVMNLMADAGNMVFINGGIAGAEQIGISPEEISLDTQGLPYSWQAVIVPATPYDASQPPGPMGLPAHIQILFGVTDPADRQPGDPVMYIIPVDAYRLMWGEAGNETVNQQIDAIYELTVAFPDPPPTAGVPVLPVEESTGVNDVALVLGRVPIITDLSASKNGYRFVGRFAQDANPITSDGLPLDYIYQGFTNDGRYLVSFFYPVTSAELPANADVMDEFNQALNEEGGAQAYIEEQIATLNSELEPSDWQPDLIQLDALVASLQISGMPHSGLQEQLWMWLGIKDESGAIGLVDNTQNYTVAFHPDNTMNYKADCNVGAGSYGFAGGMVGSLAVQLGPTTLAACPEGSRADEFTSALSTAQTFRVLPGGHTMEMPQPAGGPVLAFGSLGPADALPPQADQPIELPTPEPGTPTGRVLAPNGVNVRTGPGSEYPVIGVAPFGAEGEIVGRSADGQWWAASVPASPSGIGWVSAAYVDVSNTQNVPVIAPPPPPPTPTPAPTPTLAPAATPVPEISFTADSTSLTQGQCTTLRWNVENIQAVWVYPQGQPYQNFPVSGQGSQEVCPGATTTYEMRVLLTDGTIQLRQVTINVSGGSSLPNTSWVVVSLNAGVAPVPGSTLTAAFSSDGQVSGSGGCNTFSGPYQAGSNDITIGPLATTLMACEEALSTQEQVYMAALQGARAYSISGSQLVLFGGDGSETVRFSPSS